MAPTDRGSQYPAIRYTDRLADAGIAASLGSVGSSYDNALTETLNGLFKTELIKPRGPWRTLGAVEIATAEWVDWFNHRRLYEYCGAVPPADLEHAYHARIRTQPTLSSQAAESPDSPGRFSRPRRRRRAGTRVTQNVVNDVTLLPRRDSNQ